MPLCISLVTQNCEGRSMSDTMMSICHEQFLTKIPYDSAGSNHVFKVQHKVTGQKGSCCDEAEVQIFVCRVAALL